MGMHIVKHELEEAIDASEFGFLLKKMLPFKSLESETQLQNLWTHEPRSLSQLYFLLFPSLTFIMMYTLLG